MKQKIARKIILSVVFILSICLDGYAGNGYYTVTTNGITSEAHDYSTWKSIVESVQGGTGQDNMTVVDVYNVTYGKAIGNTDETVDPANGTSLYSESWIYCLVSGNHCTGYTRYTFHNCVFNKDWIGFRPVAYKGVQLSFEECVFNYRTPYGLDGMGSSNVDVFFNRCTIVTGGYAGCNYGDCLYTECKFLNIGKEKINLTCGYTGVGPNNSFGLPSTFLVRDCEFAGDYPEYPDGDVLSIHAARFGKCIIENVNVDFMYYKAQGYKIGLVLMANGNSFEYAPDANYEALDVYLPAKLSIVIPESGYTTYSTPEGIDIDVYPNISDFRAYRATSFVETNSYTHLYFTSTDKLNKDEGYLLRGIPGKYYVERASADAVFPTGSNGMKRGDGLAHPGSYALAILSEGLGFYKLSETAVVPVGKSYLDISDIITSPSSVSHVKMGLGTFVFDDDTEGMTHIETAESDIQDDDNSLYNISGQKVSGTYKGFVIRNGKKYYNK